MAIKSFKKIFFKIGLGFLPLLAIVSYLQFIVSESGASGQLKGNHIFLQTLLKSAKYYSKENKTFPKDFNYVSPIFYSLDKIENDQKTIIKKYGPVKDTQNSRITKDDNRASYKFKIVNEKYFERNIYKKNAFDFCMSLAYKEENNELQKQSISDCQVNESKRFMSNPIKRKMMEEAYWETIPKKLNEYFYIKVIPEGKEKLLKYGLIGCVNYLTGHSVIYYRPTNYKINFIEWLKRKYLRKGNLIMPEISKC